MKILNLYAGIGGNRKLWGDDHEITAVEINPEIAAIYQDFFPNDKMIIGDAHQYLLDHFKEYDFIWDSFPCITQSRPRFWASKGGRYKAIYPDLGLYQEIILLRHFCDCKWIVENVKPYYKYLINPSYEIDRHSIWCNFDVDEFKSENNKPFKITSNSTVYGFDISNRNITHRKDQILRNLIQPELGKHILDCAMNIYNRPNPEQLEIFS